MKELTKEQEAMAINILICVIMVFIGICFWYHTYATLWVWGLWLLGNTVVKAYHDKSIVKETVKAS